MIAEPSLESFRDAAGAARHHHLRGAERRRPGKAPLYEYTWNHTTLQLLKQRPLRSPICNACIPHDRLMESVRADDRDVSATRCCRTSNSSASAAASPASALPIVRYTTPERLNEIIALHEAHGVMIANPHVYTLEDGSRHKRADADQLGFKARGRSVRAAQSRQDAQLRSGAELNDADAPPSIHGDGPRRDNEFLTQRREAVLRKLYWSELTTREFDGLDPEHTIAVLPVAAIEQHGPHLPVATDTAIADGMIGEVVKRLPADLAILILPTQSIGKSNEHLRSPGTITLSADTALRAWTQIGEAVHRAGLRKLVMVNSHGGNVDLIGILARELRVRLQMLAVTCSWRRFGLPPGCSPTRKRKSAFTPAISRPR